MYMYIYRHHDRFTSQSLNRTTLRLALRYDPYFALHRYGKHKDDSDNAASC